MQPRTFLSRMRLKNLNEIQKPLEYEFISVKEGMRALNAAIGANAAAKPVKSAAFFARSQCGKGSRAGRTAAASREAELTA